jgi:hypothetical protein
VGHGSHHFERIFVLDRLAAGAPAAGRTGPSAKLTPNSSGRSEILHRSQQALQELKKDMVELVVKARSANATDKVVIDARLKDMRLERVKMDKEIEQLSQPINVEAWDASKQEIEDWISEWRQRGLRALEADKQLAKYVEMRYVLIDEHNAIVLKMARTGQVDEKLIAVAENLEKLNKEISNFLPKFADVCKLLNKKVVEAPPSIQASADVVLKHLRSLGEIRQEEDRFFDEQSLSGFDEMAQRLYNMLLSHLSDVQVACNERFGRHGLRTMDDLVQKIASLKLPRGRAKLHALPEFKADLRRLIAATSNAPGADDGKWSRLISTLQADVDDIINGIEEGIKQISHPLHVEEWGATKKDRDKWILEWRNRGERMYTWHNQLKQYLTARDVISEEKKTLKQNEAMAKTREYSLRLDELNRQSEQIAKDIQGLQTSYNEGEMNKNEEVVQSPPWIENPVKIFMHLLYTLAIIRKNPLMLYRKATLDELDEVANSLYSLLSDHLQNVQVACEKGRNPAGQPTLKFTKWINDRKNVGDKRMRWSLSELNVTMENGNAVTRTTRQYDIDVPLGGSLFEQLEAHVPWYDWSSLTSKSYMQKGEQTMPELDWTKSDGIFTDEDDCREEVDEFGRRTLARTGMHSCQLYLYRSSQGGRDRRR